MAAAARLFSADWVEVELAGGRLVRGGEQGVWYDGPPDSAPSGRCRALVERPLGDAGALGVLRLGLQGDVALSDREQAMLGAVAAELHSALVNAARHGRPGARRRTTR